MTCRGAYFLHIAKTGGTTLRGILEGHFPARGCAHLYLRSAAPGDAGGYDSIEVVPPEGLACFSTHAPLDTFPAIQQRLHVVTLLRDPVARTVSHYHHTRRQWPSERQITPAAYAARLGRWRRDNLQVRALSGLGRRGEVDRAALDRAKVNLRDRVAAYGTTERFDESLVLFMRLFGWRDVHYMRRNTTPRPAVDIDAAGRMRLAEVNGFDAELYAFACALLRERLEARPIGTSELARVREAHHLERLAILGQRLTHRLLRARVRWRPVAGDSR